MHIIIHARIIKTTTKVKKKTASKYAKFTTKFACLQERNNSKICTQSLHGKPISNAPFEEKKNKISIDECASTKTFEWTRALPWQLALDLRKNFQWPFNHMMPSHLKKRKVKTRVYAYIFKNNRNIKPLSSACINKSKGYLFGVWVWQPTLPSVPIFSSIFTPG